MPGRLRQSLPFYYAGTVIVLALILGGGTAQGLWTDHLLQIVMLPALFLGFGSLFSTRIGSSATVLVVLILLLLLLQFVPIGRSLAMGEAPTIEGAAFWSPAPHKSMEAALFSVSILGFFLYLTRLSDVDQERCLRFLLIGFFVNFAAGVLQLSYGQRAVVSDALPFTITAGLFANENHFSSLIYVMIPLLAYQILVRYRLVSLYLFLVSLIVGFLFAVGSRAGMAISGTLALLSLLWFLPERLSLLAKISLVGSWILSILVVSFVLGFDAALERDLRSVFFTTTWNAISDHFLLGTGLGTFPLVYPAYEARENIVGVYANHAHNDFLELFLETGLVGMALVAFFFVLVVRNFSRTRLAEAASISLLALFLHSLVDYPLRTMALGVVLAWLAAVVLSKRPFQAERKEESVTVEILSEHHPRRREIGAQIALGRNSSAR